MRSIFLLNKIPYQKRHFSQQLGLPILEKRNYLIFFLVEENLRYPRKTCYPVSRTEDRLSKNQDLLLQTGIPGFWQYLRAVFRMLPYSTARKHKLQNLARHCPRTILQSTLADTRKIIYATSKRHYWTFLPETHFAPNWTSLLDSNLQSDLHFQSLARNTSVTISFSSFSSNNGSKKTCVKANKRDNNSLQYCIHINPAYFRCTTAW